MVTRFVGSGREKEGGFLAVHKQDFEAHRTGGDWKHKADQINMNPPLPAFSSPQVQGTLEAIATFLSGGASSFLSIGDGYARGDFNVGDSGIPTLEAAFTAALGSTRLQNGGTILIKPGTFRVNSTITLPPGISVVGDLAGVYINNVNVNVPIFKVQRSIKFFKQGEWPTTIGDPQTAPELISYQTDVNKFFNLILTDNLSGTTVAMSTVPMIQLERGSNVVIERVTFLGRTRDAAPYEATYRGIAYTGANPSRPTMLHVKDCTFDVMKTAVEFTPQEGASDTLRIENCRARTVGESGATADNNAFCAFNLCNATFTDNYHIGLGSGAGANFGSLACFRLRDFSPSNTDVRMVIIGNSGGLYLPASTDLEKNLFVDGRTTKTGFEGVVTGNSWGLKINNDWYFTVGDGTSSFGDITGSDALNIAVIRTRISNEAATIIINPGTYTLTETGDTNQRPRLVGNPRLSKPIINVNGGSAAGLQGHNGINVGLEFRDLTLNAVGSAQTIKMYAGGSSDRRWIVSNCEFNDVTLNVEQVTDGTYTGITIDNCEFNQSGAYANTVSLVLSEATKFITVSGCYFRGNGYAMYIGDISSSTARFQRINIERCRFGGVQTTGNKGIDANSPLGSSFNNYIYISNGDRESDVTIRDTTVRFVVDTTSGYNYQPLDSAISDKLIKIECGTVTVDNSKMFGPYQTYTSGTLWALPTLYLLAKRGVQLLNSRFFGSLPVKVSSDNALDDPHLVRSQFGDGAWLRIDGCEFSGYANINSKVTFWCPTTLAVELEEFGGSTATSAGMVNITNSSFYATTDGLTAAPTPSENTIANYSGANYLALGCAQIYGEGWTVHFQDNDVNCEFGTATTTGDGMAGLVINTVATAVGDLADATALISGNKIGIFSAYTVASSKYTNCISVISQFANITGNHLRVSNSAGSGPKHFVFIDADSGDPRTATVSGNTLYYVGNPGGDMFDFQTNSKGMLVDNCFEGDYPASFVSATSNDDWVIERNKGQQGSIQVRFFSAILADSFDIFNSTKWTGLSRIYLSNYDSVTGAIKAQTTVNGGDNMSAYFPLMDMIPYGAKITSASIDGSFSASNPNSCSTTLYLNKPGAGIDVTVDSDTVDLVATSPATLTVTASPAVPMTDRPYVYISTTPSVVSLQGTVSLSALTVNFEW
jgi:hypothetical protein